MGSIAQELDTSEEAGLRLYLYKPDWMVKAEASFRSPESFAHPAKGRAEFAS